MGSDGYAPGDLMSWGGRPEGVATPQDVERARYRSVWVNLYYAGATLSDYRSPDEVATFERWYRKRLATAHKFLEGLRSAKTASRVVSMGECPRLRTVEGAPRGGQKP